MPKPLVIRESRGTAFESCESRITAFFATLGPLPSGRTHSVTPHSPRTRALASLRLTGTLCLLVFIVWVHGAQAAREAIASAHPLGSQAGMQMLGNGGNAFGGAGEVVGTHAVVE